MSDEQLTGYSPINQSYDPNVSPLGVPDNFIRNVDRVNPGGEYIDAASAQKRIMDNNAISLSNYRKRIQASGNSVVFSNNRESSVVDYNLRAEANNNATMGAVHKTMAGAVGFMAGEAVWSATGKQVLRATGRGALTRGVAGLAVGGVAGAVIAAPITAWASYGVDQEIQRRQHTLNTTSDINSYRNRLGLDRTNDFEVRQLGRSVASYTRAGNGFFDGEEMDRIHKIAISNNMISAKKSGSAHSGTSQQYMKNMSDLVSTTEEVVKFMNTTIEKGMSIVNELKKSGLGNIDQVRSVIRNASVLGNISGLGSETMVKYGAMGAAAAANSPYSSWLGASTYQKNASAINSAMTKSSASSRAIADVGGLDQAVKIQSAFQQNIMSSGLGSKMAAYMMDGNGKLDYDKLKRLKSGDASAAEVMTGANSTGAKLGSKRGMFNQFKKDVFDQVGDSNAMMDAAFRLFRNSKPHLGYDVMANSFIQQYGGGDVKQERMLMNLLMGPRQGINEAAGNLSNTMITAAAEAQRFSNGRPLYGFWNKAGYDIGTAFNTATLPFRDSSMAFGGAAAHWYDQKSRGVVKWAERTAANLGFSVKSNRTSYDEMHLQIHSMTQTLRTS